MQSVAYVGLMYLYAMLLIIVVGLGILLLRGVDRLAEWIRRPAQEQKKKQETGWVQIVFLSGILLFFSVYSLGILKTVGVGGEEHNHQEQTAGNSQPVYTPPNGSPVDLSAIGRHLDQIEMQVLYLEAVINQQTQRLYQGGAK